MSVEYINEWIKDKLNLCEVSFPGWIDYYKNLIDFNKKEEFLLSTADQDNPLYDYISENKDIYKVESHSGYCIVKKNKEC